jgi:hypothetical protein
MSLLQTLRLILQLLDNAEVYFVSTKGLSKINVSQR